MRIFLRGFWWDLKFYTTFVVSTIGVCVFCGIMILLQKFRLIQQPYHPTKYESIFEHKVWTGEK